MGRRTMPRRLRLLGKWWRVDRERGKPGNYGRTEPTRARIVIDTKPALIQQRDTLMHEVLHALLSETPHGLGSKREERLVASLTPLLLAAMRDNPRLVRFLTAD